MPVMFTFGILNYFTFTFRAGSNFTNLSNGIGDGASGPSDKTESKTGNHIGRDSSPCGTLSRLPLELRIMIYKIVLKTKKKMVRPHKLLGRHPPIMAEHGKHGEIMDAALLRTCRAIYFDAIPILYGMNWFYFAKSRDIREFAHVGLGNTPFAFYLTIREPSSAVNKAPYGRLTRIRFLSLKLSSGYNENDPEKIWSSWSDFFYSPEEQEQLIEFPALESLILNFNHWDLNDGDSSKLRVKPFLQKLRPKGGLKSLALIGVTHEQNLRDFKHGFVAQGGTFRPGSRSANTAKTRVSHDDLPEVSMYVRAIVEKDRAARAMECSASNLR